MLIQLLHLLPLDLLLLCLSLGLLLRLLLSLLLRLLLRLLLTLLVCDHPGAGADCQHTESHPHE